MCFIALLNSKTWSFELHLNTFSVILFGNVFFCLGAFIGDNIKLKNLGWNCNIVSNYRIKDSKYIFLLILQVVCYVLKLRYIMRFAMAHGVEHDISKSLLYYNNTIKFTTEDAITFPWWLTLGVDVCGVFGFICACILAQQLLSKQTKGNNFLLLVINYIVAIIGGMSSGGRGGAIQILLAFLFAFIILYQRKFEWKKSIPLKRIYSITLGLCLIVTVFTISTTWVGKIAAQNIGRYLSNYIGAQIYNLDYRLNTSFTQSRIFGEETFYPIIQKFAGWFNITRWTHYHVGDISVNAAGYNTGNVQTAFYSYFKDFGLLGVIFIPIALGVLSQIIYRYARKSPSLCPINMGLIIYLILAYVITYSFFGDKFGSLFLTFNTIKKMFLLYCLLVYLYKLKIGKAQTIIITS
ncbi:MAG: oligosaccharide repeat unit polymerase [Prevotella sp.]|nr:oligosaccharide repeat unit polymerase [Prevotella sp.]